MEWKFSEFSKFRESDKSVKHEHGYILGSSLLPVSCWLSGNIQVSYKRDYKLEKSF